MNHLRVLKQEPEKGYSAYGMVYLGQTKSGDIIVDCCRNPKKENLPGRLYRKDMNKGGKPVHRSERASGKRKEAINIKHKFLGEHGT